jgi:NAD(P)-dependent dehydrogenase (short-subunit alcohol dehydrogenase family)
MAVNVTSTWRMIRTTDPLLRKSDAGRAIIMSSGAAQACKPFWGPYSASKAAVEALARTWAGEAQNRASRQLRESGRRRVRACAPRRCRAKIR